MIYVSLWIAPCELCWLVAVPSWIRTRNRCGDLSSLASLGHCSRFRDYWWGTKILSIYLIRSVSFRVSQLSILGHSKMNPTWNVSFWKSLRTVRHLLKWVLLDSSNRHNTHSVRTILCICSTNAYNYWHYESACGGRLKQIMEWTLYFRLVTRIQTCLMLWVISFHRYLQKWLFLQLRISMVRVSIILLLLLRLRRAVMCLFSQFMQVLAWGRRMGKNWCVCIWSLGFDTEAEMVDYMVNSFGNQCDNPLLGNLFTIHSILIFWFQPELCFPMKLPIPATLHRNSSPTRSGMALQMWKCAKWIRLFSFFFEKYGSLQTF